MSEYVVLLDDYGLPYPQGDATRVAKGTIGILVDGPNVRIHTTTGTFRAVEFEGGYREFMLPRRLYREATDAEIAAFELRHER